MNSEPKARSRALPSTSADRSPRRLRRLKYLLSLAAFLFLVQAPELVAQSSRQVVVFRTRFTLTDLHNGLDVILIPYDTPGVVAYWTIVRAGSRNEVEPGRSGYAHLFEHLMFRGTKTYPQERYNEVMSLMGADHNAFTDRDWTVYTTTLPASELPRMIEIQADRFQNLSYDEAGHVQECGAVLGEFNIGKANPQTALYEKLFETAYTVHTYRHTEMGWEEDVRGMPEGYEYGLSFFQRHYRPDNCAIVVAGDFEEERVLSLILKHYQRWEPGADVAVPQEEPPQTEARHGEVTWASPTSPRIVMGFHVPRYDPNLVDAPGMDVLRELAFGPTSPFYRRWVEESLRARSVSADVPRTIDPGLFTIEVVLNDEADLDDAREDILKTLAELASNPPTLERLAAIRDHLRFDFLSRLETSGSLAYTLGQMYNLTGDPHSIHRYFSNLAKLELKDIVRLASKYLVEQNSTTVTLVSAEES